MAREKARTLDPEAVERAVVAEAWTSDLPFRNLLTLCDDIGVRFGGSDGEHRAADFLEEKLREYGLANVHSEEFAYTGWTRGPATLEVLAPIQRSLTTIALPYSPVAQVEGEVISVGQGEVPDFERIGASLRGKIALSLAETTRLPGQTSSHRREKYLRAVDGGATAFLYVSQNPGQLLVTGSLTAAQEAEIPGVAISYEDGATLLRLLQRGPVTVRMAVAGHFQPVTSRNVMGDIPGRGTGRQMVMGGHYDTHDICVGALDNAAGSVVGLEMARVLSPFQGQLGADLRFIFFAGEEIGLLGSWDYAGRHQAELSDVVFMLNLDTAGRGSLGSEALMLMGCPDLVPYFEAMGRAMNYPFAVDQRQSAYSDHFPFVIAGVPAGTLTSKERSEALTGRGWGHTAGDSVDKVQPRSLAMSAVVGARLVLRIAEDPSWPGRHLGEHERQQLIEATGLDYYLRRNGKFPFQP